MSSEMSYAVVGPSFVKQYYHMLSTDPASLHKFYKVRPRARTCAAVSACVRLVGCRACVRGVVLPCRAGERTRARSSALKRMMLV